MPLEGYRVLDLSIAQVGPYAATMLAQMGADVIKIEDHTTGGDNIRGIMAREGIGAPPVNYIFEANNRNKRSVGVNLKTRQGRDVIYRLVKNSHIFLHNLRQSGVERLGVDYETLHKHNPLIIYASGSSFGKRGPDRDATGYDIISQARGGIMSVNGPPDRPPMPVGGGYIPVGDQAAAMLLAYGVALAIIARERTGKGQEVHVSMLSGLLALQNWRFEGYLATGEIPQRVHGFQSPNPLYDIYQAQDGEWIALSMTQSDVFWSRFCKVLNIESLEFDSRFNSHQNRIENRDSLVPLIQKVFSIRSRAEWTKLFMEHDLQFAPVNNYADLAVDPQVIENNYVVQLDHPIAGPVNVLSVPVELSETPGTVGKAAPELGQHTEEVLTELGGYTQQEIVELMGLGVVG
ncbi:CaiB/BaiF CoA transferase family protein [Chloroflexota bacterium]